MKKFGCLFKSIILLAIIIGIGYYYLEKYGGELLEEGKNLVLDFSKNKISGEIDKIYPNEYKDSLNSLIDGLKEKFGKTKDNFIDELPSTTLDEFRKYFNYSIIVKEEFEKIKKAIIDYEERKKN
ncbi:MAG: hypothetical protein KKD86_13400 [Bacteroidetes bacterium]|nr:hypothetical protein [Bacteroidota bacterium]